MADHAAGLAARQLGHVGVNLLRHDRSAGAKSGPQVDEAGGRGSTTGSRSSLRALMRTWPSGGCGEFDSEVAVAQGVEAVLADAIHAQRLGNHFT